MKIFLSYASEDRAVAEDVYLALTAAEHEVFFDRGDLKAGTDFHARIEDAVKAADLVVFLISDRSIAPGGYTLTELKYVREKWPHPKGRLVPVKLGEVLFDAIPAYLRSVTVLEPEGDVAAEAASAVARVQSDALEGRAHRRRRNMALALAGIVASTMLVAGLVYLFPRSVSGPPATINAEAMLTQASGNGAELLRQLRDVNVLVSVDPAAMQSWLEHSNQRYRNIADATLAVLKGRQLKSPANLDVIAYKYARLLGLDSEDRLPNRPDIDVTALSKAIVAAYNEQNGADAKSVDEIVN
jgi:hypothetical protein